MFIKPSFSLKKYFSTGLLTLCLGVLICVSSYVSIGNMEKKIKVVIDGKESNITTYRSEVASILAGNDIVLGPKDKIEPSLKSTVIDGDLISITKAKNVQLQVDGETRNILTAEEDVASVLAYQEVVLGKEDTVSLDLNQKIQNGLKIAITRVNTVIDIETESIDYSTVVKKDYNAYEGTKSTVQQGQAGERQIKTQVVYEDGKEVSRTVVSDSVVKQPVDEIVSVGTLGQLALSRGGTITYTNTISMKATAYTLSYSDTGKNPGDAGYGKTASGRYVVRDSNGYSTVAVDPRVIPLGTKLYVEGYGYAIAADTGGAVKGNIVDLYFDTKSDCYNFGVRKVKVYVLK
jgi:uncharacterized protein YabE (DUF348 family)